MWTQSTQQANHLSSGNDNYNFNGINIYCTRGVHEKVFDLFLKTKPNQNSKILILGSGEGAFDERLIQNGYKNITSVEFCDGVYKSSGKILIRDLNKDFDDLGKFDYIFAIEVIEHLENHFHFVRNINSLLSPMGSVYITSPNTESSLSRVKFFLRGTLNYFSIGEMLGTGHINPVFLHILKHSLEKNTNLKINKIETNTSVWAMSQYPTLKQKLFIMLSFPFAVFIFNKNSNQINILEIKYR